MCAFVYLAKSVDARTELTAFMDRHPEKTSMFLLVVCATAYNCIKTRIKNVVKRLSFPFAMAKAGAAVLLPTGSSDRGLRGQITF
jgi:hypothetical protein